jgi:hypothetical protein
MLLYTRNLIPKTPARILGKHCQITFFEDLRKPKAPNNEVTFLNHFFGGLRFGGNAYVIGDSAKHKQKWHVYYATTEHP